MNWFILAAVVVIALMVLVSVLWLQRRRRRFPQSDMSRMMQSFAVEAVGKERLYRFYRLGSEQFPVEWCHKRMLDGPQENVWLRYSGLKQEGLVSAP